MKTYRFKSLRSKKEWTFSNGEVLDLPRRANILVYEVYREANCIMVYPKKKDKKGVEHGLSEQGLDISMLGELEEKLKELSS